MTRIPLIELITSIEQLEKELNKIESTTEKIDTDSILEYLKKDIPEKEAQLLEELNTYLKEYCDIDKIIANTKDKCEEIDRYSIDDIETLRLKIRDMVIGIDDTQINIEELEKTKDELKKQYEEIIKKTERKQSIAKRLDDVFTPITYLNVIIIPIIAIIFHANFSTFFITYLLIVIGVPVIIINTINILSKDIDKNYNEKRIEYKEKLAKLIEYTISRFNIERLVNSYLYEKLTEKIETLSEIQTSNLSVDNLKEASYNEQRENEENNSQINFVEKTKKRIRKRDKKC